jgi:hypothetical protein
MTQANTRRLLMCAAALLFMGCLAKVSVLETADGGVPPKSPSGGAATSFGGNGTVIQNPGSGNAAVGKPAACVNGGPCEAIDTRAIDKLDLLFVIDNSPSMQGEQALLAAQFPRLVNILTSGSRGPDDPNPFPRVKDLHVGVVSTDMGVPGVDTIPGCDPNGGDDGRLQNTPHGPSCDNAYPPFLAYSAMQGTSTDKFAADLACIAQLGTSGCGVEQPFEAALKALWPSVFIDPGGNVATPNPITFLSTTPQGTLGRGDRLPSEGGNLGFLRSDPGEGLSALGIVVLSDEDDCSIRNTATFKRMSPPAAGWGSEQTGIQCFKSQDLYDLKARYASGYKLLRIDNEDLVVFGAIVGVPADLVDVEARARIDFSDPDQRALYYGQLLDDPRMQSVLDPSIPANAPPALARSCIATAADGTIAVAADPPRRIVSLAREIGENAIVQSICHTDFAEVMDPIVDRLTRPLGANCLSIPLARTAKGLVDCEVIWELPQPGAAPMTTPTSCAQLPYLKPVASPHKAKNERGGNNCVVRQLAVTNTDADAAPPQGEGWFYDDYSSERNTACRRPSTQRIAFTPTAKPPTRVNTVLDCHAAARVAQ